MEIEEIKLNIGMTNSDVNELISEWIKFNDSIYLGVDYKHNWKCKCGNIIKDRSWYNVQKKKRLMCKTCSNLQKQRNIATDIINKNQDVIDIGDVKIVASMTNTEVNKIIYKWLMLKDDVFKGADYNHKWICKCGNLFIRRWSDVKNDNRIECKNCKYDKIKNNHKLKVEYTGEYEYIDSYFIGDFIPEEKKITSKIKVKIRHKYCNEIYITRLEDLDKSKCGKCCGKYENSFAYHIEKELNERLDKYWDFEKNTVNPYFIYKNYIGSRDNIDKVWIKCTNEKKPYHNSYRISCPEFIMGSRCSFCSPNSEENVHILDSIYAKFNDIANMIYSDEFNNKVDTRRILPLSNKKFYFKCDKCGEVGTKARRLSDIVKNGYPCKYCSDGISIPEKFVANILKQSNIKFTTQLSKKDVEWIKDGTRYDFYINELNMIIEVMGEQHKKYTGFNRKLDEEKANDIKKYNLAIQNGNIEIYIKIDCEKTKLDWMRDNIKKELSNYIDLNNVKWEQAWENSQNSLCVRSWELWNEGFRSTKKIGKILNLHYGTVCEYLKRGAVIGKCDYCSRTEMRKNDKQNLRCNKIKVRLLFENGDYKDFDSMANLWDFFGISHSVYYKYIKTNGNVINIENLSKCTKSTLDKLIVYNGCKIELYNKN